MKLWTHARCVGCVRCARRACHARLCLNLLGPVQETCVTAGGAPRDDAAGGHAAGLNLNLNIYQKLTGVCCAAGGAPGEDSAGGQAAGLNLNLNIYQLGTEWGLLCGRWRAACYAAGGQAAGSNPNPKLDLLRGRWRAA